MIRRCEGEPVGQPEHREPSLRPRQLTAIYAEQYTSIIAVTVAEAQVLNIVGDDGCDDGNGRR